MRSAASSALDRPFSRRKPGIVSDAMVEVSDAPMGGVVAREQPGYRGELVAGADFVVPVLHPASITG